MPETKSGGAAMPNKQLVEMLLRSRLFRDYESVFTKATGLPLALRPLEYWQLEHHHKTNENHFCALLAERPATLAVCLQSHAEIIKHTGIIPCTETCPFGLTETAVPVQLGEETIGFLRIGQVLRRSAIQTDKARAASKLKECGVPFSGGIRKAWEATPIIPKGWTSTSSAPTLRKPVVTVMPIIIRWWPVIISAVPDDPVATANTRAPLSTARTAAPRA